MIAKYTIDRKRLYDSKYEQSKINILEGTKKDKIGLKTHIPVIYTIIKTNRRKELKQNAN